MFYFTWADPPGTDTEPDFPTEFPANDEDVFSFRIQQTEGDFATLEIEIQNPRVGLLGPGRPRWAWLSFDNGTEITPLFFGRLVGVPQSLQDEIVRLNFVARPPDFNERKAALAETLRVAPYFDPLFIPFEELEDPERVLDARPALWHIDRTSLDVTISHILTGEDGTEVFDESDTFEGTLDVSYGQAPARRAVVTAEIGWQQRGSGVVNITPDLLNGFANATTFEPRGYLQEPYDILKDNMISLIGAQGFVESWPQYGASLGGGWQVGRSTIQYVGEQPDGSLLVGPAGIETMDQPTLAETLNGAGLVVQVIGGRVARGNAGVIVQDDMQIVWIPITHVAPFMELNWTADRARTEGITFTVNADVQDVLTDVDEAETILINVQSARVDEAVDDGGELPIADPLRRAYFPTARGQESIQYLISLARAALLMRARTVNVSFETTLERGVSLSCRKSVSLTDARLPGGSAAGKVKSYAIVFDGDSGEGYTEVEFCASVGQGGTVTSAAGSPTYVEAGYETDYQVYSGVVVMPHAGEVTYDADGLIVTPDDDGLNLQSVGRNFLQSVVVTGGLDEQTATLNDKPTYRRGPRGILVEEPVYNSVAEVQNQIRGVTTNVTVTMTPVTGGPFRTDYALTVSELKIPKTIDLEAT